MSNPIAYNRCIDFGKAKKKPAPDDSDDSQEEDISSFDMGKLQKML